MQARKTMLAMILCTTSQHETTSVSATWRSSIPSTTHQELLFSLVVSVNCCTQSFSSRQRSRSFDWKSVSLLRSLRFRTWNYEIADLSFVRQWITSDRTSHNLDRSSIFQTFWGSPQEFDVSVVCFWSIWRWTLSSSECEQGTCSQPCRFEFSIPANFNKKCTLFEKVNSEISSTKNAVGLLPLSLTDAQTQPQTQSKISQQMQPIHIFIDTRHTVFWNVPMTAHFTNQQQKTKHVQHFLFYTEILCLAHFFWSNRCAILMEIYSDNELWHCEVIQTAQHTIRLKTNCPCAELSRSLHTSQRLQTCPDICIFLQLEGGTGSLTDAIPMPMDAFARKLIRHWVIDPVRLSYRDLWLILYLTIHWSLLKTRNPVKSIHAPGHREANREYSRSLPVNPA